MMMYDSDEPSGDDLASQAGVSDSLSEIPETPKKDILPRRRPAAGNATQETSSLAQPQGWLYRSLVTTPFGKY